MLLPAATVAVSGPGPLLPGPSPWGCALISRRAACPDPWSSHTGVHTITPTHPHTHTCTSQTLTCVLTTSHTCTQSNTHVHTASHTRTCFCTRSKKPVPGHSWGAHLLTTALGSVSGASHGPTLSGGASEESPKCTFLSRPCAHSGEAGHLHEATWAGGSRGSGQRVCTDPAALVH